MRPALLCLLALAACAELPDLPQTRDPAARAAPYPALVPLAPLLAGAAIPGIGPQTGQAVEGRAAALRARAAALRGPVVDAGTRARMRDGVSIPASLR